MAAEQAAGTSKFPNLPSKTNIESKNQNSTLVTIQTRKLKLQTLASERETTYPPICLQKTEKGK